MPPDPADVLTECSRFRAAFSTLVMATTGRNGEPEASYAPYVTDASGALYVYLSDLSRHTGNLRATGTVSVLFIADEAQSAQPFARQRLTLTCSAAVIPRDDARWPGLLDQFKRRFGELVDVLRDLQDFHLFRLEPVSGIYVRGFAQAYELSGEDLQAIRHITDKGHRSASDGPADD